MITFEEYQKKFVDNLFHTPLSGSPGPSAQLRALVDAIPYYGNPDFRSAHRGTLCTLLRVNMADNAIAAQPTDIYVESYSQYSYKGPFSGYRDAFCHGAVATAASTAVATAARAANPAITPGWWQDYAIAVLTDAARQAAGLSLNNSKLTADLAHLNSTFASALTASVLATVQTAYQPTANALRVLTASGQLPQACADLVATLSTGALTANLNIAISQGGDAAQAAVWFLYTLWITMKAVGCADVDAEIRARQAAGLTVPPQIGPQRWWQGGYATWYTPLASADIAPSAGGMLTAGLPERKKSVIPIGGFPPTYYDEYTDVAPANGYSRSLCEWGPLARYKN